MQLQSVFLSSILNTFNFTTTGMSTAGSMLQEGGHTDLQPSAPRPVYFLSHGGVSGAVGPGGRDEITP